MDIQSAYKEAGTLRGAAAICGTTHKTVKRILHHANVVVTSGESYRMKEARTRGKGVTDKLERQPEEWGLFLAKSGYFYMAMDSCYLKGSDSCCAAPAAYRNFETD